MQEIKKTDLDAQFQSSSIALISCLSFEERSLAVAEALGTSCVERWLAIVNEDIETDISVVRSKAELIAKRAGVTIEYITTSKRNPLRLVDALILLAGEGVSASPLRWVADITTMTHEMLLIIIAAADEIMKSWNDLTLLYNVASQYSGDDKPEEKWISRGIQEVRSVVGYPGAWSPGERTTLVALPGLDTDRMRLMVEEIEPDELVVGIACPADEHHSWTAERSRTIAEQLLSTRKGATFDYPALDPFGTIDAVIQALHNVTGNILLAPLNSKVSTAALGILARHQTMWQVCYAPAFVYNLSYSTPSDSFLTCSLDAIKRHVASVVITRDHGPEQQ